MKKLSLFYLLWGTACLTQAQTPANDPNWTQIWSDNFQTGISTTNGVDTHVGSSNTNLSYYSSRWTAGDNFDHNGEPELYQSGNAIITNGTGLTLKVIPGVVDATCNNGCWVGTTYIPGFSNGGVYSYNSGTWSNLNGTLNPAGQNLGGLNVSQLVYALATITIGGTTFLFAGTNDAGIFVSIDGGNTWSDANNGFAVGAAPPAIGNIFITCLAVNGQTLYAGTRDGGVYYATYTYNSSLHIWQWQWNTYGIGFPNSTIYSGKLPVNALIVSGFNLIAATGSGVYYCASSSSGWLQYGSGSSSLTVNALALNGSSVLAGTSGSEVFSCANASSNWSQFGTTGLPSNTTINALAVSGGNVIAGTTNGVFYSTGNTWTQASSLSSYNVTSFAINGSNLYAGTSNYLYSTSDLTGATGWSQIPVPAPPVYPALTVLLPTTTTINALTISGGNLIVGIPGAAKPHHYYTSGEISTNPVQYGYVQYGYIEASIRMSDAYGLFPAFWFWNTVGSGSTFVADNSIECFEIVPGSKETCSESPYYGSTMDKYLITNNMYNGNDNVDRCGYPNYTPAIGKQDIHINDYTQLHKYGVEWSPTEIVYYIDDIAIRTSPNPGNMITPSLPFQVNNTNYGKSIILNLALYSWVDASNNGDNRDYNYNFLTNNFLDPNQPNTYSPKWSSTPNWSGNTDATPELLVQYISYYQLKGCGSGSCPISGNPTYTGLSGSGSNYINNYPNQPQNSITIQPSLSNLQINNSTPNIIRATDHIEIQGGSGYDFLVPAGLTNGFLLDVNGCY